MFGFEKIANWWDTKHHQSEDELQLWVNNSGSDFELYSKAVFATVVSTSMALGQGMVDILRLGEGVKEGGWGYAKDGLRLLSLAGPLARLGRLGMAKWVIDPGGNWCASITMAKALRQTGVNLFIRASEMIAKTGRSPGSMGEFIPVLKSFGARVKEIPVVSDLEMLKKLVSANPKAVVLFGVSWKAPTGNMVGHAMYAFRNSLGIFKIADRTGKIVSSLNELKTFYHGIETAVPQGSAVVVYNALITEGTSLASMLAIEVKAFVYGQPNDKKVVFTPVK